MAKQTMSNQALAWIAGILFVLVLGSAFAVGYLAGDDGAAPSRGGKTSGGSLDGAAFKGAEDAPVTMYEWSDFECPFCGRFFQQTLPQIDSQYIATGKVKFVYKDFPLSFHANAQKAAEAGKCALEQGSDEFWAFHDKVYANQAQLSPANIKLWAAQSGVDVADFNECLDSGRMASIVQQEMAEGQQKGVQGTPGFVIVSPSGKETLISGAVPFAQFQAALDAALAE